MVKRLLAILLLTASCAWAQNASIPNTGQITAATTNATCANNGTQNGGAVDQSVNQFTGAVGISVTGTWTATLNIQLTVDHGKTWTASGATFSANQQSVISTAGNTDVCVFASAYTSGTAIVNFATAAVSTGSASGTGAAAGQVQGTAANGAAAVGNPVLTAGANGATVETIAVNAAGQTEVVSSNIGQALSGLATQVTGSCFFTAGQVCEPLPVVVIAGTDPCQSNGIPKLHAFATITTATTTALVAVSGSTVVYVCEIDFELTSTTASTLLFEQGTGVACATGPTSLSATYTNAATSVSDLTLHFGAGATFLKTAASNGFCAVSTVGTSPSIPVDVTYVQQ